MMKRAIAYLILIVSLALCIYTSASGESQEKEGKALDKSADSIEAAGEKKQAGAPQIDNSKAGPERPNKKNMAQAGGDKEKPALTAERKQKENKKKQQIKETPLTEESDTREPSDGLLQIDNENLKYNRIPGLTVKAEDRPEDKLVKVPDEKISGKTKDKKPQGGLFGLKTDTVAKVGLLIVILIILILYKARSKKSRRKIIRNVTKR